MERITPTMLYQYLTCPEWLWLDRYGDLSEKGEVSEVQQKLLEEHVAEEDFFIAQFIKEAPVVSIAYPTEDEAVHATERAMKRGEPYIYHAHLRDEHFFGVPTLLVKREGGSRYGDWYYEPVLLKSSHDIKDEHKYELLLHGLILENIQHTRPEKGGIITVEHEFVEGRLGDVQDRFFAIIEKIQEIITGEKPPLQLTKACMNTPWGDAIMREAERADDIALIYKIDKRSIPAFHEQGIHTVEDARTMNIDKLNGLIPHLKRNGLERVKLQAESLKTNQIFMRFKPKIPAADLEIYFDIEGDPLHGAEYLFGFLLNDQYKTFVAEKPQDQELLWRGFLEWIRELPEKYVVFHYSPYEKSRLTFFAKKFGGMMTKIDENHLERFIKNMFDLNEIVKDDFIFPIYFYGLKQICKHLGFAWDNKDAGGVQSIEWYEDWLRTGNRDTLETIKQYNHDDVRATKFLKEWLIKFGSENKVTQ